MQSSKNNDAATSELPPTAILKQTVAAEIEALVQAENLSYLEAVTWWMEERSIPENQFAKYIPEAIIETLKAEVVDDRILKPSLTKENKTSNLDFLYG